MQRDESITVNTDAQRVDGHSFESGYELHDIGEQHARQFLTDLDLAVESWGIDRRDDPHVLADDRMDLQVFADESDEQANERLLALIEVKVKSSEDWFGVVNRHHFKKYLLQAHHHDAPAFIYMAHAVKDEAAITRETWLPVQQWDELQSVLDGGYDYYDADAAEQFLDDQIDRHPQIQRSWRAPDGNTVVQLDVETGVDRGIVADTLTAATEPRSSADNPQGSRTETTVPRGRLEELVTEWRYGYAQDAGIRGSHKAAEAFETCADELAAVIDDE